MDRSFGDIPLVHGMPFISGVGIEALQNKILRLSYRVTLFSSHALYSRPRPYGDKLIVIIIFSKILGHEGRRLL